MNAEAINSLIIWKGNTNNNLKRRKYLRNLLNGLVKEHVGRRSTKVTGELRTKIVKKMLHTEEEHQKQ